MRVKKDNVQKKTGFIKEIKQNRILYLMCLPALAVLIAFCYIPFTGIWMAFTDFNVVDGIFGSKFVGLDNFKYFFDGNSTAWKVTINTLVINLFCIIFGLIVPISIAIFFNEVRGKLFKKLTQSAMFFPYFLSWVVVGAIIYGFFARDVGLVNGVREMLGLDPISWYAEPKYWKAIIIFANVWKWSGYNSIIYMAAMSGFDPSLFEAAEIDGANKIQRIWYLTLPMLKSTAVVLVLLSVGRIFYGDFGMIYGIVGNNPSLSDAVSVIDTYVYSSMRILGFSYSTAIGLYQSIMGLILVTLANKFAKKINDGEGLF
ncbi:MAG: binding-protein-dependent transport system inner rane component [Lachnospiraceae bacterium]|jgi:multiple sugar transport system permease protein/putative aldouronate transport system permease protein|nr:binding-protein-dependent transport system inner rane component [Lachnospiraceae bacterium]